MSRVCWGVLANGRVISYATVYAGTEEHSWINTPTAGLMLDQRFWRWYNIKPTLVFLDCFFRPDGVCMLYSGSCESMTIPGSMWVRGAGSSLWITHADVCHTVTYPASRRPYAGSMLSQRRLNIGHLWARLHLGPLALIKVFPINP